MDPLSSLPPPRLPDARPPPDPTPFMAPRDEALPPPMPLPLEQLHARMKELETRIASLKQEGVKPPEPPPENRVTAGRMGLLLGAAQKVGKRVAHSAGAVRTFARAHPFMTLGAVVSALLLSGCIACVALTLTGHDHFIVAHAQIFLGTSGICMALYYGIAIINMVHVAPREEQTKQLERIQALRADMRALDAELLTSRRALEARVAEIQAKTVPHRSDPPLLPISDHVESVFGALEPTLRASLEIEGMTRALLQAQEWLQSSTPDRLSDQALGFFPSLPLDQVVPLSEKYEVLTWRDKIGRLPQEIKTYMMNKLVELKGIIETQVHAGKYSKVLLGIGVAMILLMGVALTLYFTGRTHAYFFGPMSLSAILPVGLYGACFFSEAHTVSAYHTERSRFRALEEELFDSAGQLHTRREQYERLQEERKQLEPPIPSEAAFSRLQGVADMIPLSILTPEQKAKWQEIHAQFVRLGEIFGGTAPPPVSSRV